MTSRDFNTWHLPVLLDETVRALAVKPDGLYLDLTCGGGGHSASILERLGEHGKLYAADRDSESVRMCEERLLALRRPAVFRSVLASFSELKSWLPEEDHGRVAGVLADLGVSSHQLDTDDRGFSYLKDGPLDMRMNQGQSYSAEKLVAESSEQELTSIFRTYGEERYAAQIAGAIVKARNRKPIRTTGALAEIVAHAVPARARRDGHPARRVFQAIRMSVNQELEELRTLLDTLPDIMASGGRVVIISFHSLEDRLVKQAMRRWECPCDCPPGLPCVCGRKPLGHALWRRPVTAGQEEQNANPRSRSAKLRAFVFEEVQA